MTAGDPPPGAAGPVTPGLQPPGKTSVTLADGRSLMYFGAVPARPHDYPDLRDLAPVRVESQARWDQLLGEWVVIASHRQERTFQPGGPPVPAVSQHPG